MSEKSSEGLTRRAALRRIAVVGGSVAWATPVVQTISAGPAFAQYPLVDGISYIALNVTCGTDQFFIKYEADECVASGGTDCFEDGPKAVPDCELVFTPTGTKADGEDLGFSGSVPDPTTGAVTITVGPGCTVDESVVKGAHDCCPGPTGGGTLVFSPPDC